MFVYRYLVVKISQKCKGLQGSTSCKYLLSSHVWMSAERYCPKDCHFLIYSLLLKMCMLLPQKVRIILTNIFGFGGCQKPRTPTKFSPFRIVFFLPRPVIHLVWIMCNLYQPSKFVDLWVWLTATVTFFELEKLLWSSRLNEIENKLFWQERTPRARKPTAAGWVCPRNTLCQNFTFWGLFRTFRCVYHHIGTTTTTTILLLKSIRAKTKFRPRNFPFLA